MDADPSVTKARLLARIYDLLARMAREPTDGPDSRDGLHMRWLTTELNSLRRLIERELT